MPEHEDANIFSREKDCLFVGIALILVLGRRSFTLDAELNS